MTAPVLTRTDAGGMTLGSLDEAKEIYEFYSNRQWDDDFDIFDCPRQWEYIGDGSSRIAYRAPSGVVYKVQRYADDTYNCQEHANFEYIRKSGRLPMGWRIPTSALFIFEAMIVGFDRKTRTVLPQPGIVAVIALEFIEGKPVGYGDYDERERMLRGMNTIGLFDGARGNALRIENGFCIVDAGEGYLNIADEVYFSKLIP